MARARCGERMRRSIAGVSVDNSARSSGWNHDSTLNGHLEGLNPNVRRTENVAAASVSEVHDDEDEDEANGDADSDGNSAKAGSDLSTCPTHVSHTGKSDKTSHICAKNRICMCRQREKSHKCAKKINQMYVQRKEIIRMSWGKKSRMCTKKRSHMRAVRKEVICTYRKNNSNAWMRHIAALDADEKFDGEAEDERRGTPTLTGTMRILTESCVTTSHACGALESSC